MQSDLIHRAYITDHFATYSNMQYDYDYTLKMSNLYILVYILISKALNYLHY